MGKCCAVTLNKRVTIQNVTRLEDGQGGFTETWTDAGTVWASLEPYKGWERYQANQVATPITHRIVMRYTSILTTESHLVYGDRYFGVKEALKRNEEKRFLDIRAVELESVDVDSFSALLIQEGGYLIQQGGGRLLLGF